MGRVNAGGNRLFIGSRFPEFLFGFFVGASVMKLGDIFPGVFRFHGHISI